jgi:hypothetical protein
MLEVGDVVFVCEVVDGRVTVYFHYFPTARQVFGSGCAGCASWRVVVLVEVLEH